MAYTAVSSFGYETDMWHSRSPWWRHECEGACCVAADWYQPASESRGLSHWAKRILKTGTLYTLSPPQWIKSNLAHFYSYASLCTLVSRFGDWEGFSYWCLCGTVSAYVGRVDSAQGNLMLLGKALQDRKQSIHERSKTSRSPFRPPNRVSLSLLSKISALYVATDREPYCFISPCAVWEHSVMYVFMRPWH